MTWAVWKYGILKVFIISDSRFPDWTPCSSNSFLRNNGCRRTWRFCFVAISLQNNRSITPRYERSYSFQIYRLFIALALRFDSRKKLLSIQGHCGSCLSGEKGEGPRVSEKWIFTFALSPLARRSQCLTEIFWVLCTVFTMASPRHGVELNSIGMLCSKQYMK